MAETIIKIALGSSPYDNDMIHNRWHPDIPMVPGSSRATTSRRVLRLDGRPDQERRHRRRRARRRSDQVHFLSGPIGVEGAEPGDLLVVDILDIGAFPQSQWGFTGIFSKRTAAAS